MAYAVKNKLGDWVEITGEFVALGVGPENFERRELEDGKIVNGKSLGPDDLTYPAGWCDQATPEQIAAAGVKEIAEPATWPQGVKITGSRIVKRNNGPAREYLWEAFTFDELKENKLEDLLTQYTGRVAQGFAFKIGETSHRLQIRMSDLPNWLGLKSFCDEAIANGGSDTVCPMPVRTAANQTVSLKFGELAELLTNMRAYMSALMAANWAIKDAIGAAETEGQLVAIDVSYGWPANV